MKRRKNIKQIITVFLLCLSVMSTSTMEQTEPKNYKAEVLAKVLSPWIKRGDDASNYMSEAIKSNSVKKIVEHVKGKQVITLFDPQTKNVDITINVASGDLHETIEFNLFIRWLDVLNEAQKNQTFFKKKNLLKCILF